MRITSAVEILENPKKFPSDRKNYKLIKLENGLKALLIKKQGNCKDIEHNDTISYVALCIDVGSFEDPFEVQGLCHFLEHMVFMGSEKFPKENEFDQYIKSRNGFDNAMTECEFTIFYFKVDTEHLHGALERFANFFISPLMSLESMFREMEAVESEFQNNVNNDVHRVNQLFASMVRDTHPASYFTWGNHKTLKTDIALKDLYFIVHEFRKRFYKSNRMNLCIQTSLGLEAQQRMKNVLRQVKNEEAKNVYDIYPAND
ncbi:CLUMA_CG014853, isoform A [Clunio marinus]|uniref:CLUMA_CG014853, isoform A n=1 Tax=Clunio marinus TaxID=568069 RepID=A0A1J1IM94_9DIPT|nr:CLUMA_CG014853, isoform A [Clunio marinus]